MLDHPELTDQAMAMLRKGENFHWILIPMLAAVMYIYFTAVEQKKWNQIAAGLSLYMTHWFFEILNALIQKFSGYALWTVPAGTSFLLLVGVGAELSLMFSVAGLLFSKILPEDPKKKILGLPNRLVIAVGNAAFFSVFEIFLARTPAFHWVYPWWGSLPVFITVYIPFFVISMYCHDWPQKVQKRFIGTLAGINASMLIVFAGILHWI